jgi:hypothetical protein
MMKEENAKKADMSARWKGLFDRVELFVDISTQKSRFQVKNLVSE